MELLNLLLSATGPLLQSWFSARYPGRSPYRLYAISNAGSLLALVGYPFLFEPFFGTVPQAIYWSWGFGTFVVLILITGLWTLAGPKEIDPVRDRTSDTLPDGEVKKSVGNWLSWMILSMLPSILLLAVTNQLCQEIAVIPFLWIVPLSLYLLTFIICFDQPKWYRRDVFLVLMSFSAIGVIFSLCQETDPSLLLQLFIFPVFLFSAAMVCHGELVRQKPAPAKLTFFYLVMSLGGALGGVFSVIVAPLIFTRFIELHLAISGVLILGLWNVYRDNDWSSLRRYFHWLVFAGVTWAMVMVMNMSNEFQLSLWAKISFGAVWFMLGLATWDWIAVRAGRHANAVAGHERSVGLRKLSLTVTFLSWLALLCMFVVAPAWSTEILMPLFILVLGGLTIQVVFAKSIHWYPPDRICMVLGLVIGLVIASGFLWRDAHSISPGLVHESRGFYGLASVVYEGTDDMPRGRLNILVSGRINHGFQYSDPEFRRFKTSYFGESSGLGKAFLRHPKRVGERQPMEIGVIGLGAGAIAAWSEAGDRITFFEINEQIKEYALRYFTFIADTPAVSKIVMGDGRLMLEREMQSPGFRRYDLLAIDAFAGDAIPRHLLTLESASLYVRAMAEDGILAINVSNFNVDMRPVVFALTERVGLTPMLVTMVTQNNVAEHVGQLDSIWIIATRNQQVLKDPEFLNAGSPYPASKRILWTDDFGSLAQVLTFPRPAWWPWDWWPWEAFWLDPMSK